MSLPNFFHIRQLFPMDFINNISETMRLELQGVHLSSESLTGSTIAITAGSRGIDRISEVLRCLVRSLRY